MHPDMPRPHTPASVNFPMPSQLWWTELILKPWVRTNPLSFKPFLSSILLWQQEKQGSHTISELSLLPVRLNWLLSVFRTVQGLRRVWDTQQQGRNTNKRKTWNINQVLPSAVSTSVWHSSLLLCKTRYAVGVPQVEDRRQKRRIRRRGRRKRKENLTYIIFLNF